MAGWRARCLNGKREGRKFETAVRSVSRRQQTRNDPDARGHKERVKSITDILALVWHRVCRNLREGFRHPGGHNKASRPLILFLWRQCVETWYASTAAILASRSSSNDAVFAVNKQSYCCLYCSMQHCSPPPSSYLYHHVA